MHYNITRKINCVGFLFFSIISYKWFPINLQLSNLKSDGEGNKTQVIFDVLESLSKNTNISDDKLSSGDLTKTTEALDTMLNIANDSDVDINEKVLFCLVTSSLKQRLFI